jgi:photosystem II stability/assembly factor-like uncharacterized protein
VSVGNHGLVLRTTDRGSQWNVSNAGTSTSLLSVCFPTEQRGFAAGVGGVILRTDDGGANWNPQTSDTSATTSLWGIAFVNAEVGWAVGGGPIPGTTDNYSTILHTTDGGAHWIPQPESSHSIIWSIWANNELDAWAVGSGCAGGVLLHTIDGGQTWPLLVRDFWNQYFSLFWVNDSVGWISGDEGVVLHTTDRGMTWDSLDIGTTRDLPSIAFADEANGWAVGATGTIMRYRGPYSPPPPPPENPIPLFYTLSAYPNPFNPATVISLDMPAMAHATLRVYNLLGQSVETLTDRTLPAGHYAISFDASNLPSGIYFVRLESQNISKTQRLILLR